MMPQEFYTEIILEKSMDKEHFHPLDPCDLSKRGFNASCGDDITVHLHHDGEKIVDASYTGSGCAISKASTAMMLDLIIGQSKEDAKKVSDLFLAMIKREVTEEEELEDLGDAVFLQNISQMPARVKCAVLCWHALQQALAEMN